MNLIIELEYLLFTTISEVKNMYVLGWTGQTRGERE